MYNKLRSRKCNKSLILATILSALVVILTVFIPTSALAEGMKYYGVVRSATPRASSEETINYTRYEVVEDVNLTIGLPNYNDKDTSNYNECAAVAGSNVVAYYDHSLTDLIPNYTPTIIRGPKVIFKGLSQEGQNVINSLYASMHVNQIKPGCTEDDFKNGLREYVQSNNHSITYNSAMTIQSMKDALNNQVPLVLFCEITNFIDTLEITDTSARIITSNYNSNHVSVIRGFKQVKYFNGDNNFRTDTYLNISSGVEGREGKLVLMASLKSLDDIVATRII